MNEACLVIHPHVLHAETSRNATSMLDEAVGLAEAIHLDVAQALIFQIKKFTPRTYIGGGQVEQCRTLVKANDISIAIINAQLSPTQQRNLERAIGCKVIDRTGLILEIFGERAQTAEGRLQVELAALTYQKSRLVRSWTHLERQRGGAGFMGGPGETQIETDRRLIADRITSIKQQLEKVVRTRELHRKRRQDKPFPIVALVGYTNAGKSTLFNRLGGANVMAKDMLFATLDPTIRRIELPSGQEVLLSDTVGFISDLPHELIAAFRATLEEVHAADLLIHVRDASNPEHEQQADDVEQVLEELCGDDWKDTSVLEVFNKVDLLSDASALPAATAKQVVVSAITGDGIPALLHAIEDALKAKLFTELTYSINSADGKACAWLYEHGHVSMRKDVDDVVEITVALSPVNISRFGRLFGVSPIRPLTE